MSEHEVAALVRLAAAGDRAAWEETVERYSGLLWAVTRSYRLSEQTAADVVQTVWLRLLEHIGDLRDPAHLGGWLATTTRREALRTISKRWREEPADVDMWERADPRAEAPDTHLLRREEYERLLGAFAALPVRQRRLLRLLSAEPRPSYADVAAALDMPVGSIGPTRARALARLRSLLAADGRSDEVAGVDAPTSGPELIGAASR